MPAQRKQFGQPIASFGAIKHKLGEMIVRTYAVESLIYRTAGMIDARIEATPHEPSDGSRGAGGLRGVRHRGVDRQGRRQRNAQLRARREHPDSRRQRLRARLPGRAPLPRRAREPDLRGHQRDQPAADSRHAGAPGGQGRRRRSSPPRRRCRTSCSGRRRCRSSATTRRWPRSGAPSTRSRRRR